MELTVDRIAVGGKGLGLDDNGRATFVAGSLPTERVVAELRKEHKRFADGYVIDVLEPSKDRVEPGCPHAVGMIRCGGCDWQHVSADGQRTLRVDMVEDALRRIGKIDTSQLSIRQARPLPGRGYRTGVRMLVDRSGALTYRRPRSHEGFRPESCLVAHPLVDELIRSVRSPGSKEASIRVGAHTGEQMVIVDGDPTAVVAPPQVSVAATDVAESVAIHEIVAGRRLRVSGGAFFQSSPEGAEELVRCVGEALADVPRSGVLVDAYSGGGLFSATIGSQWTADGSVIAVEVNPVAVADAVVNAPHATTCAVKFENWDAVPADAVIVDPSRSGLARQGVATIVATEAEVVVLVSCDAGALGRDAGLMSASGYVLTEVTVLDMFNQTSHVEVVSRFERSG